MYVCTLCLSVHYTYHTLFLLAQYAVVIPYEQVVQQLSEDTISTNAGLGMSPGVHFCGKFPQVVWISIKVCVLHCMEA